MEAGPTAFLFCFEFDFGRKDVFYIPKVRNNQKCGKMQIPGFHGIIIMGAELCSKFQAPLLADEISLPSPLNRLGEGG